MHFKCKKHPGYSEYLLISDDLILNYWNLVGLNRDQIWEGPQDELKLSFGRPANLNRKTGNGGVPSGDEVRVKIL